MDFSIRVVTEGLATTLHVEGEVDLATTEELSRIAGDALEAGATTLVLDLAAVTFMDSSGLAVLVALNNQTTQAGRALVVRNPTPRVLEVLRITGLDDFLPLETDAG